MKVPLRASLALLVCVALRFSGEIQAQSLQISSITLPRDGVVRLTLNRSSSEAVHIEATEDFGNWTEVTNAIPDPQNAITFSDKVAMGSVRVFRVFAPSTETSSFVATVRAEDGTAVTNARVTIFNTGQVYLANAAGQVTIPTTELTFETGFRLRASAPGFLTETIDLPPALYEYTFTLVPTPLAPTAIAGRTYSLGESNTITLFDSGIFRWKTADGITTGAYSAARSAEVEETWNIRAATPNGLARIGLTFDSQTSGRVTNIMAGATTSGTFAQSADANPPVGQAPAPPTSLKTIRFITVDSPLGVGLDFTVTFTGQASGTFTVSGNFEGGGTFTYTPSATGASLRLNYSGLYAGDYDEFALKFVEGAGLGVKGNVFTGTTSVQGTAGPVLGTFSYE